MKYNSILCFLSALLFINVSSAAFIRVINAVPESLGMDVWVLTQQNQQVQNQNQNQSQSNQTQVTPEPAIRLFQNVTYGDIPPYFFITDKSTPWVFMFSNAMNQTQLSASQVQMMQNFSSPLQPNNNYTLIVASGGQGSTDGSSNFQYLLLTDRLTGQEQPAQNGGQTVYVRLLNVATPGQLVTLISGGSCPAASNASGSLRSIKRSGTVAGVVTQSGRPMQTAESYAGGVAGTLQSGSKSASQSQAPSGSATYAGGVVGTVQSSSQPAESTQPEASPAPSAPQPSQPAQPPSESNIIATAAYLRAGAYVPLPANANRENLQVCVGGQSYPVYLAASYRGDSIIYSVVVFQSNSQSQDAILKRERLMREEGDFSVAQPQLDQSQPQNQTGGVVAFITDDIPLAVNNSRIRTIHAASQVPAVDVYLDGQLLFTSVNYATVTMYQKTYRGLHNITIVPSQGSQNQNENSTVQFPYTFLTFLAWDRFYTLAILPTGVFMMQGENQTGQSEDNLVPTRESGFLGPLHRIFLDDFAPNAAITSGVAYVQIVHLAPNAGPVTANVTGTARLLLPLENTFYYPIQDTNRPIALMLLNSMQGQQGQSEQSGQSGNQNQGNEQGATPILVSRSFQPNTLYTVFVLDAPEGNNQVNALIVRDRSVLINCRAI